MAAAGAAARSVAAVESLAMVAASWEVEVLGAVSSAMVGSAAEMVVEVQEVEGMRVVEARVALREG